MPPRFKPAPGRREQQPPRPPGKLARPAPQPQRSGSARSAGPASFRVAWAIPSGRSLLALLSCRLLIAKEKENKVCLKEIFLNRNLDHVLQPFIKIFVPNPFPFLNVCVNQFDLGCGDFFLLIEPVALLGACSTFQFSPTTESSSPPQCKV